ncbi:unnamed protein product [Callosobruchus maculatus]|uniref:Uncharacterized protein n=1 Tax=Callosobruchus maculatus TaxID=64391 RepID=A0A653CB17_CALMS|nr:unnamed protein product [Callosobruchus maculatus]
MNFLILAVTITTLASAHPQFFDFDVDKSLSSFDLNEPLFDAPADEKKDSSQKDDVYKSIYDDRPVEREQESRRKVKHKQETREDVEHEEESRQEFKRPIAGGQVSHSADIVGDQSLFGETTTAKGWNTVELTPTTMSTILERWA